MSAKTPPKSASLSPVQTGSPGPAPAGPGTPAPPPDAADGAPPAAGSGAAPKPAAKPAAKPGAAKSGQVTDISEAPGRGKLPAGNSEKTKALVQERHRIVERMESLKNEKLRRQLADLEAQLAPAEAKPAPAAGAAAAAAAPPRVAPAVPRARARARHWMALAGFVAMVILPIAVSAWYLWTRAHDRYVSYAGFSVRTEEIGSAFELLGGVAQLSGSSSSDTDILYKFVQSPELVARIDADLDLRAIWSAPGRSWSDPEHDPIFAYKPDGALAGLFGGLFGAETGGPGSIEDLTGYWGDMVGVYSDSGTGLIDLEVQAFTPGDARAIAERIYAESSEMINRLSAIARDDATRYAREELDLAVERLKTAREAMTRFRNRTQIVDPTASIQGQMGLLNSLQAQLAEVLIDLDIQRQTAAPGDPRIAPLERRVEVIEERIAAERQKLGIGEAASLPASESRAFADLVGEYERLAVDQEFAQSSYTAALANYDSALAEAQRQSRYLAAHVSPTLPEAPSQPARAQVLGLVALFSFLIWATVVLALYALKDRR